MEHGPLPPHERTWRHPSEVAAQERADRRAEAATPSTRLFALVTGTAGLLAVGVLIVAVTPPRQESPIAVGASSTVAARAAEAAPLALSSGTVGAATPPVSNARSRPTEGLLATPVGDDGFALITSAALGDDRVDDRVAVRLASGATDTGRVVALGERAALIELAETRDGHTIASRRPEGGEMVVVMVDPPMEVAFDDLEHLDVDEGTAVLTHEGELVGLCTRIDDDVELIEISDDLAGATSAGP